MSASFRKAIFVLFTYLSVTCVTGRAEQWMRGAAAVTIVQGQPLVEAIGGATLELSFESSLPQHVSGLLKVRTEMGDSVFFKTSNQISIYN